MKVIGPALGSYSAGSWRGGRLAQIASLLITLGFIFSTSSALAQAGVKIISVSGKALREAGVRPGDVMVSWKRPPAPPASLEGASGLLESAFDWEVLMQEQAPRGTILLSGIRGLQHQEFEVKVGMRGNQVTPILPNGVAFEPAKLRKAITAEMASSQPEARRRKALPGLSTIEELAGALRAAGVTEGTAWVWYQAGLTYVKMNRCEEARYAFRVALASAKSNASQAILWHQIGRAYAAEGLAEEAEASLRIATERRKYYSQYELGVAADLEVIGLAWYRIHSSLAKKFFSEGLELRRQYAPHSPEIAGSLSTLGAVAWPSGNFVEAAQFFAEALEIKERLDPGSEWILVTLENLAGAVQNIGDLDRLQALRRKEQILRAQLEESPTEASAALEALGDITITISSRYQGTSSSARQNAERCDDDGRTCGVLLEHIPPDSPLASLGQLEGYAAIAWKRTGSLPGRPVSEKVIRSTFDWYHLEREASAPGKISVVVTDGASRREIVVPEGPWKVQLRPILPDDVLQVFDEGDRAIEAGELENAVALWQSILRTRGKLRLDQRCWLHDRVGQAWVTNGKPGRALATYALALSELRYDDCRVRLLEARAEIYISEKRTLSAISDLEEVLKVLSARPHKNLHKALAIYRIGLAWLSQDPAIAVEKFEKAALIQQVRAPLSLALARTLTELSAAHNAIGNASRARGSLEEALAIHRRLRPGQLQHINNLISLAEIEERETRIGVSIQRYEQALNICSLAVREDCRVEHVLDRLAHLSEKAGQVANARSYLERLIKRHSRSQSDSGKAVTALRRLARLEKEAGNLAAAAQHFRASNRVMEVLADSRGNSAKDLKEMGDIAIEDRKLKTAIGYYEKALGKSIESGEIEPERVEILISLGSAARQLYDLSLAESYYLQAKAAAYSSEPARREYFLAAIYNGLGLIERRRSNTAEAADYYSHSIGIYRGLLQGKGVSRREKECIREKLAEALSNLGHVVRSEGKADLAEKYYVRSLQLWDNIRPRVATVADGYLSLAELAQERDLFNESEERYKEALRYSTAVVPSFRYSSRALSGLAGLARSRDELAEAERLYSLALEETSPFDPESPELVCLLRAYALVLGAQGKWGAAEPLFSRALKLARDAMPGTIVEASSLSLLARLYGKTGQGDLEVELHLMAVKALQVQLGKLGGDTQGAYLAHHSGIYQEAIRALHTAGAAAEALAVADFARGRTLLSLMTRKEADRVRLPFDEGVAIRRACLARYEETIDRISALDPFGDEQEIETLRWELSHIRRMRVFQGRSREIFGDSGTPFGHEVSAIEAAHIIDNLDVGSILLYYHVVGEEVYLFAARKGFPVQLRKIDGSAEELRDEVANFYCLLQSHSGVGGALLFGSTQIKLLGERLYSKLLRPVEEAVESSERLLLVPDGPLHRLPFSALIRRSGSSDEGSDFQYLIEWKPLHSMISSETYARSRANRFRGLSSDVAQSRLSFVGVGDVDYTAPVAQATRGVPATSLAKKDASPVLRQVGHWSDLPHSRVEVESIAGLFEDSVVLLADRANKSSLKAVANRASVLHFATHGFLDQESPSNSALILAPVPGGGPASGALYAWEVVGDLSLQADLVVLSACETAVGQEQHGEGLVGLSRAFLAAGARSVIGTLWSVLDEATAEFMLRFYRYLTSGLSKDVALQLTQVSFIRGDSASGQTPHEWTAPFFWAGFQLSGDWK